MTKYYRVRTQEQWEWLCNKLNFSQAVIKRSIALPAVLRIENDDGLRIDIIHYGAPENVSEVSNLMEESKMKDYVTISGEKLLQVKDEDGGYVFDSINGVIYGSELPIKKMRILKSSLYPKVRMSVAEKKEFDELKKNYISLYEVLDEMDYDREPKLYSRLFRVINEDRNSAQLEFARAWADASLIEVIPDKKWYVLVPKDVKKRKYLMIDEDNVIATVANNTQLDTEFTAEDIKNYGLDNDLFKKVEVRE